MIHNIHLSFSSDDSSKGDYGKRGDKDTRGPGNIRACGIGRVSLINCCFNVN